MRAKTFSDLLKAGDRVAVSNITGREGSSVTAISQEYCRNIVGGWALGKGGFRIDLPTSESIPVFSTVEEMFSQLPREKWPNKVIVYSPPSAVYGEVKGVVDHGRASVETIYIITEHVSVEVTAKIGQLCRQANIDVVGCNSLGVINALDQVRVGAVGGDTPAESFRPGCVTIISNSGNMVNTMASYLHSAGLGTAYGISTGKDPLILMPLADVLALARGDERTKLIVLYIEPGGLYEKLAVDMLLKEPISVPIIAYITGEVLSKGNVSLGHAGAVVEGKDTDAPAKMRLFDDYFGIEPFDPDARYRKSAELTASLGRGIRIRSLHHLPGAAKLICDRLGIERDFAPGKRLRLNPWFVNYRALVTSLPSKLVLPQGVIPEPYRSQVDLLGRETLGASPARRNMRNASHASSNDGKLTRIYGHSLDKLMQEGSFVNSLMLAWLGEPIGDFQAGLVEKCLIASISNGPGTISAQGAKLSASAGNAPNTAIIASLACIGEVHGGNGRRGVEYLLGVFKNAELRDPFDPRHGLDLKKLAHQEADRFNSLRTVAKEAGSDYERLPGLGHPVFHDQPVNYDPRERIIARALEDAGRCNVFLDFMHLLSRRLKEIGIAKTVWAVNLDAAIAAIALGVCWKPLIEKRITVQRTKDIAFSIFAIGRAAGAVSEYLDHQDFGSPMDTRIPTTECVALNKAVP
jgi:succinyl-CoA synthetase alpha subunit